MALLGHASAHAPQVMQLNALPSMILIACVGHSSTHFPMPSHLFVDRNMTITF
jgi:exosortase/archaeosortase